MATNNYNPNIAIHPGATLKELLESLDMTQIDLAERTGLTSKTINEIIQEKNPITPETALRFSAVFGMSPSFWNNLERNYQETFSRLERDKKLEKELPALKKFSCYRELTKWGYLPKTLDPKEKVLSLLNFFGVSSLEFIPRIQSVAFRKSAKEDLSKESLAAWLRCGEKEGAKIETIPFDKEKLVSSIESLRSLTNKGATEIEKNLQKICADFGVAVVFVPYFPNTYVDGATRWLTPEKALIQVSLRGAHVDRFWFTFFHELGHLLKHGKKVPFVEFENKSDEEIEIKEAEANEFANKTLIPESEFEQFINSGRALSDEGIIRFARQINISPAIVAGRIAHELDIRGSKNVWGRFSHLRTRLHFVSPK